MAAGGQHQLTRCSREIWVVGRWRGETEPGLLPLTHKRLVRGLCLRLASAPPRPHQAGGAADERTGSRREVQGPVGRGHPGRGGPTRLSWLFLRRFSLRAAAELDPPSRAGQDRAADLPLTMWAMPRSPSTSWQRRPRVAGRPTPSLPGAGHAFVHAVCVAHRRLSLWVGDTFIPSLPGELSHVRGTQEAFLVRRARKQALRLRAVPGQGVQRGRKDQKKTARSTTRSISEAAFLPPKGTPRTLPGGLQCTQEHRPLLPAAHQGEGCLLRRRSLGGALWVASPHSVPQKG